MNKVELHARMKVFIALAVTMMLSACATNPPVSDRPAIEDRAQQRWETIFEGDLAGAYEFLSPGYRSSVDSLTYQRNIYNMKVSWTKAEVVGSECEGNRCKVGVTVHYEVIGALPGVPRYGAKQKVFENWVKTADQWWFVPSQ